MRHAIWQFIPELLVVITNESNSRMKYRISPRSGAVVSSTMLRWLTVITVKVYIYRSVWQTYRRSLHHC
jgi:hypothetical protein